MDRWIALLGIGLLGACGPSTVSSMDEGATTDSETGAPETGDTGADTGVDGGSESGVVDVCEPFADEQTGFSPVTIEVHNAGTEAILLADPCSGYEWIHLSTASEWEWPRDFCSGTCEETFEQGCFDCGACAEAAYVVVAPGGTRTVEWDGRLYERLQPPMSCFEYGSCAPNCQVTRAPVETIQIAVEAITETDCIEAEENPMDTCMCEAGPEGWCETYGNASIDPTLMATAELQPGTTEPIVIEIGG